MQDNLSCRKITLGTPEGRRRVGRPNLRWRDGVKRKGWELGIGGLRPWIEMDGGLLLSRPRPCMGCSAWDDDDDDTVTTINSYLSPEDNELVSIRNGQGMFSLCDWTGSVNPYIPSPLMWYLCWIKWHWDRFFSEYLGFFLL
jgi:hypothetical protein